MVMAVLGILLGLLFIIFPAYLYLTQGSTDMWVQPVLGVIFISYGIKKIMIRNSTWEKLKNRK